MKRHIELFSIEQDMATINSIHTPIYPNSEIKICEQGETQAWRRKYPNYHSKTQTCIVFHKKKFSKI